MTKKQWSYYALKMCIRQYKRKFGPHLATAGPRNAHQQARFVNQGDDQKIETSEYVAEVSLTSCLVRYLVPITYRARK